MRSLARSKRATLIVSFARTAVPRHDVEDAMTQSRDVVRDEGDPRRPEPAVAVAALLFHLERKGLLFHVEKYPHNYPHCWRCKPELLFRLVDEWYVNMNWREEIIRVSQRPRDAWVISKKLLGIHVEGDPCSIARDCLSRSQGDKLHAVRLYMQTTGSDLEGARKVIESNMVMGW